MLSLGDYRAILMRAQNLLYLKDWEYGKPQLYGSAMESVQNQASVARSRRLEKLHLNQDGIKRGRVAQVRKFL